MLKENGWEQSLRDPTLFRKCYERAHYSLCNYVDNPFMGFTEDSKEKHDLLGQL